MAADRDRRKAPGTRIRLTDQLVRFKLLTSEDTVRSCFSPRLRNDTAGLLRRVEAGEQLMITVKGRPVASLVPVPRSRRRWIGREELVARLRLAQADPGLRDDLARLAGDTTDDLGPIR